MTTASNRLAEATSPYLQQHAKNPVDWWPWCEEALATARREDKPILLSIGYSACHWCHVMAHESFEDPDTARVMNALFVNIKVDREERPDLDKIYQSAHQLLSGRPGGWPLTVVLTPDDQVPFFAGTYFPKTPRHGLPGFQDLVESIARAYREQNAQIRVQNRSMLEALDSLAPKAVTGGLDSSPLDGARDQLAQSYDGIHGGFGQAPKFPHVTGLERLLRHWAASRDSTQPDRRALDMVVHTLGCMAEGGIYDQVGGGFCRYSVDDQWIIPHFEKMLYDNGPLLGLYSDAWLATRQMVFQRTAEGIATWVMREMQSAHGPYYSTLDADSEGEEGKFYVWDRKRVRDLLDETEYTLIQHRYGLDQAPNFEGKWHLHAFVDLETVARQSGLDPQVAQAQIDAGLEKLFRAREERTHPGRDEKILTAWNALMIKGMARAARVFGRSEWLESAERALAFLRRNLWRDGRLLATHKDGRSHLAAYLDDYAFLIDALLELLQTRWRPQDLDLAVELANVLLAHFEDPKGGGFFFTADDHEQLIHRPKPLGDESTPAGNGIAAQALQRLGYLLGEPRYLEAVEHTLKFAWRHMSQIPYAHASLLTALEENLEPAQMVILRGEGEALERWKSLVQSSFAPRRLVLAIPNNSTGLPQVLASKPPRGGAVAYVCTGDVCEAPIGDFGALEKRLGSPSRPPPHLGEV